MFVYFINIFLFLILQSAYSDVTTISPAIDDIISDNFGTTTVNTTQKLNETSQNITIKTQSSQTQQIERSVPPEVKINTNETKKELFTNFRPSPPLEPFYEFNKSPVAPVYPDPKHVSYFQSEDFASLNKDNWNMARRVTTDQPWTTHVKFPTTDVADRPYSFTNTAQLPSSHYLPSTKPSFAFNKPVEIPKKGFGSVAKVPAWEKHGNRPYGGEYNLLERPPAYAHHLQKTYESGGLSEGYKGNPWKKIIKFLTAFIPISLLISALTPTVITVTAVNETQTRYRNSDAAQVITKKLLTSLDQFSKLNEHGCEDRVLCELLLAASNSKNGEEHVQNLLNNFAEHEKDIKSKADELKKVFEAVKVQNCEMIHCKNIKSVIPKT